MKFFNAKILMWGVKANTHVSDTAVDELSLSLVSDCICAHHWPPICSFLLSYQVLYTRCRWAGITIMYFFIASRYFSRMWCQEDQRSLFTIAKVFFWILRSREKCLFTFIVMLIWSKFLSSKYAKIKNFSGIKDAQYGCRLEVDVFPIYGRWCILNCDW